MPIASVPYILVLGFFFGSTLIASRFSVGQIHPTNYVTLRLAIASLAHLLIYTLSARRRFPRDVRLWGHAALLGVLGTAVPMTSIVSSMLFQSSGLTSILLTAGPAFTVILAHFFLPDESLNLRKLLGVSLALGGALILAVLGESGLPNIQEANPLGYGLVLLAMFFGSSAAIYIRRYMKAYDSFDIASIRMFFAAIALTLFTAIAFGFDLSGLNAQGGFALGYASVVGTFLGLMLAVYIVQRFGATPSAMTAYVIPVVAALGGVLVLGEQITWGMLAGMAMIAIGIAIINRKPSRGIQPVQG